MTLRARLLCAATAGALLLPVAACPPLPAAPRACVGVVALGACVPPAALAALCHPARVGASRCVPLEACREGAARDADTGACVGVAAVRDLSAAEGRPVPDDFTLACAIGDELRVTVGREIVCAPPLACSAARADGACAAPTACPLDHVAAEAGCVRVRHGETLLVDAWARAMFGGDAPALACSLLDTRLGPSSEPRRLALRLVLPGNEPSGASLEGDAHTVRALEPLLTPLRLLGGVAPVAAIDVTLRCPESRRAPVPQPAPR